MVTLRAFHGIVPTDDVGARTVGGARRSSARLARRATHDRHVAWLEGTLDEDPVDVDGWLAEGSLRRDESPRLRLVEQTLVDGHRVVGALGLADIADLVPHEQTDPAAVRRRAQRDRRQQVDSRPLLAVLPTDPPGIRSLVAGVRARAPEVDVTDVDGIRHRVWVLHEDEATSLTAALDAYPCLLADGHHRVAAAGMLGRTRMPTVVTFAGMAPRIDDVWRLAAIPRDARAAAAAWVADLDAADDGAVEVLYRDLDLRVARAPDELPVETSQRLADAVPGVARVTSTADPSTMAIAVRDGAVVIGSRAPSVTEVLTAVAGGRSLPPKSTSFRPKPRVGLVLHRIEEST